MDDHLLSLIVPAFNEEKTLAAVLEKVLRFIPDVHEILVIDDASVDRTPEVCHSYTLRDPRIKLFRHHKNLATAALQTGFAACSGSIVVVQDADLEYDPAKFPTSLRRSKGGGRRLSRFTLYDPARRTTCIFATFWRTRCSPLSTIF